MGNRRTGINNIGALNVQISTHRSRNSSVTSIRYQGRIGVLTLRSTNELRNCLNKLDAAMATFNGIVDRDVAILEGIRDVWIRTDSQSASRISCHSSGTQNGSVWPRGR